MKRVPVIFLIAGSNGAGKTTFATEYFPTYVGKVDFINADLIAQGLSPFSPDRAAPTAGRMVLQRIGQLAQQRKSFAVETTLAGRTYATLLRRMKAQGYQVHLYYLWIPSYKLALERIRRRVQLGGHGVPTPVVRRRFGRALRNLFRVYDELADYLLILDNSAIQPCAIAEKRKGRLVVFSPRLYQRIRREAQGR